MLLTPFVNYSRGTIKRMRRHGREYDIILDEYIKASGRPAPFGLLVKSHKTGKFVWFDRKRVHVPSFDKLPTPELIEDIESFTPDYDLFDEYLDHLIKTMPKRGKEKYVIMKVHYRKQLQCLPA